MGQLRFQREKGSSLILILLGVVVIGFVMMLFQKREDRDLSQFARGQIFSDLHVARSVFTKADCQKTMDRAVIDGVQCNSNSENPIYLVDQDGNLVPPLYVDQDRKIAKMNYLSFQTTCKNNQVHTYYARQSKESQGKGTMTNGTIKWKKLFSGAYENMQSVAVLPCP